MTEGKYLNAIEAAHRKRCERFCYVATIHHGGWCISIAEAGKPGYYPLLDYVVGSESMACTLAEKFNRERLDIGPREAAIIVASSMADVR